VEGTDYQQADEERLQAYIQALEQARIPVTVRRSRGKDIDAACGQLANRNVAGVEA
jgi:23S rRNA (adenine2503-C2)-methyltransferase